MHRDMRIAQQLAQRLLRDVRLKRPGFVFAVMFPEQFVECARKAADRVLFMADGAIVEEATPEQFFTNPQSERAKDFLSKILEH